jgi:hypothetical protein
MFRARTAPRVAPTRRRERRLPSGFVGAGRGRGQRAREMPQGRCFDGELGAVGGAGPHAVRLGCGCARQGRAKWLQGTERIALVVFADRSRRNALVCGREETQMEAGVVGARRTRTSQRGV